MNRPTLARSGKVLQAAFGSGAPVVVGSLAGVDANGAPLVDYPGNPAGAIAALIVGQLFVDELILGAPVALAFDGGDRSRPLILGIVNAALAVRPTDPTGLPAVTPAAVPAHDLFVNGVNVQLTAQRELTLRCGNASIVLRRDGKLVIKGDEVVSRASGANKIRGGTVDIN